MKQIKNIIGCSIEDANSKLIELGFKYDSLGLYRKNELRVSLFGFFSNLWKSHKQKQPLSVDMVVVKSIRLPDVTIRQSKEDQKQHFLVGLPNHQLDVNIKEVSKKLANQ